MITSLDELLGGSWGEGTSALKRFANSDRRRRLVGIFWAWATLSGLNGVLVFMIG
jgi:hypothetical protein